MANALKYQYKADEILNKLYQKGLMGDTNNGFLQTLIDNSLVYGENVPFWQECFTVDGNEQAADLSDMKKNPAWTVTSFKRRIVPMASAMAPLSEGTQLENEGFTTKTGSMYQWNAGTYETSLSRIELEAKLKSLNIQDQTILGGFVKSVADVIKSHNSRISNMAAQTLSQGGAYSNVGQGFDGVRAVQEAYIPLSNYKKAGAKVWSDLTAGAECDIPEQMRKIEDDFKEAHGLDQGFAMQWDIPYAMARNVLLKNPKFIAEINRYIRSTGNDKVQIITVGPNGIPTSAYDTNTITIQQLMEYSRAENSKVSPIHIVKEKQVYADFTTYTNCAGWSANKAVLRPLGMAGVVTHAKPKDVALFQSGEVNDSVSISTAMAQGFLYVVNKVSNDGVFKKYMTDVLGTYATVLNEIQYHVVVDTETADA